MPWVNRPLMPAVMLLLMCMLTPVGSAEDAPEDTINVAYAHILGSGIYDIGDRTAHVLNMPFEFILHEPGSRDWTLNLLLPVTVGVLDVDWGEFWGGGLDGDRLQTLGLTPGIEVDIPLAEHWTLKPFVQAGYVYDLKEDYDAWVYMGGLRSLLSCQLGAYTIGLGAAITVVEQKPVSRGDDTGIRVIDLGLDVRHALDMRMRGQPLELSVFAIASHYYNDLDLLSIADDSFHIDRTYEVGLTLHTAEPLRLLGMDWQRMGVGYMWGDGIESITFNLGFPF